MKTSFRHMMIAFYAGAIVVVLTMSTIAVLLQRQESRRAAVPRAPSELTSGKSAALRSAVPSGAAVALFAVSPQAAFDAWATCSKRLFGEDAATSWLASNFGEGARLGELLERYAISADAPMAILLELAPERRQFQSTFAAVFQCSNSAQFIRTAWPLDSSAPSPPRLIAERNGYSLALHGSLSCASWPGWIAVSDSTDFASAVAESFVDSDLVLEQKALDGNTAVAFLYPERVRSVWKPLTAWLRVAMPSFGPRMAHACDLLEPALAGPGPVVIRTSISEDGLVAHATWLQADLPGLTAMLEEPQRDSAGISHPSADAIAAGTVSLSGALGAAFKSQLQHLAESTHDADAIEGVARIAAAMKTSFSFEVGPSGEEKSRIRFAWSTSDDDATEDALESLLPAVEGANSTMGDGIAVHAARVVHPLYFAVHGGNAVAASDVNDVRDFFASGEQPDTRGKGTARLLLQLRGAHMAHSLEQSNTYPSLDTHAWWYTILTNSSTAEVSWNVSDSVESLSLHLEFSTPSPNVQEGAVAPAAGQ
ncbi:MAG: hypothetical protein WC655_13260 [Candidatus Hydrogenedentales bacterium]|jgi:hypothetical protein